MARECYENSLKNHRGTYAVTIQPGEPGWIVKTGLSNKRRPEPTREVRELEINGKRFKLGASFGKELEDKIAEVILKNMSAFAWSSTDMLRIHPNFLCHRLTMDEKVRPVVQKQRKFKRKTSVHGRGNSKTPCCQSHKGNPIPRVVSKCGHGKEGKWEVEDVRRLHQLK